LLRRRLPDPRLNPAHVEPKIVEQRPEGLVQLIAESAADPAPVFLMAQNFPLSVKSKLRGGLRVKKSLP
jgi:hypothetical protein